MKKKELLILIFILLGACIVRLYHFNYPILDWHAWRQVDTSAVSRSFVEQGFDIFHPKFEDLSIGVSLLDNPKGYRFVEFPIYNVLQAGGFLLFNHLTLEEWGRLVTIFASLGCVVFLYLFVKKYVSERAGMFTAFFFAFAPYDIYYGRTVLPDTLMVMCMLGGLYFFDRWVDKKNFQFSIFNFQFLLATLFTASAILLKPFVLFFSLPFLCIAWNAFGKEIIKRKSLWFFLILSVTPFILWRVWMQQYPEGIPQSNWLFNGSEIRFKGAFFHWLFADRIAQLMLGYFGLPFVIIGILERVKKEGWIFLSCIVSACIYMFVIATGNVQHDYYQMLIMPTIAIFFGKGIDFILTRSHDLFNTYTTYIIVVVSMIFSLAFSWFAIRDYYTLQHYDIAEVGAIVDNLVPKNTKVIAPFGGDTTFLYYTKRQGWPVVDRPFYKFVKAGAEYIAFVDPTPDELDLQTKFTTVARGSHYAIFDLTKPTAIGKIFLQTEEKTDLKKK